MPVVVESFLTFWSEIFGVLIQTKCQGMSKSPAKENITGLLQYTKANVHTLGTGLSPLPYILESLRQYAVLQSMASAGM